MKVLPLACLAVAVRIALTLYGEWVDARVVSGESGLSVPPVKYTDVDYVVFSDGAAFVARGQSPYRRDTYRYTPALAWLMLGNVYVHPSFGKWLFLVCDVVVALLLARIATRLGADGASGDLAALLWLWNPLSIAISTRGNAESLLVLMVLAALYSLLSRHTVAAAVWLGLAVHFKVYPILYTLPFLVYIGRGYCAAVGGGVGWGLLNRERVKFACVSASVFLLLGWVMYSVYGWEFVEETYTYHLSRRDHRHNFSPYFYAIYLTFESASSHVFALAVFLPQLLLVTAAGLLYGKEPVYACFLQTVAFVHFNKVITSQYFVWYLCFLPVIAPSLRLSVGRWAVLAAIWFGGQGIWLSQAYLFEIRGLNSLVEIWMAGFVHFGCLLAVLVTIARAHNAVVDSRVNLIKSD